jgi:hypothetical protein
MGKVILILFLAFWTLGAAAPPPYSPSMSQDEVFRLMWQRQLDKGDLSLAAAAPQSQKTEHDCTLTVVVEDGPREARYRHWCHTATETLRMDMPADYKPGQKNLQSGQKIKVRGKRNVDAIGQPTLELDGTDVQFLTVPAGNPQFSTIPNKTIVIAVSYADQPSPQTAAQLKPYYTNIVNPVAREMSQGLMYLVGIKSPSDPADFVDVTISLSSGGCDVFNIVQQAFSAAQAKGFGNGGDWYHRLVYHIPASPCGWSGVSTLGWYGGYSIINGQQDVPSGCRVVCHEVLGHAVAGHYHSHRHDLSSANCCYEEYGDWTDYMGSTDGVLNPWQRKVALWFDTPNTPQSQLVTATGDYTITSITEPGIIGARALRLQAPLKPDTEIWVSYNTAKGHYGQLGKPVGVYVHSGGTYGGSSYLLPPWPLDVGATFHSDVLNYGGVWITTKALSATTAQIHIDFAPPVVVVPPTSTPTFSVTVTK